MTWVLDFLHDLRSLSRLNRFQLADLAADRFTHDALSETRENAAWWETEAARLRGDLADAHRRIAELTSARADEPRGREAG